MMKDVSPELEKRGALLSFLSVLTIEFSGTWWTTLGPYGTK